jgi:hypothetical protein
MNSLYNSRPVVEFDPSNADHRKWLGDFTRTRSWGNCPVKLHQSGAGNNVAQMQLRLLEYYSNQEFNKA